MEPLILIVDDEKPIRHFIKVSLEAQGYRCIEAENGKTALIGIASHRPELIILDLGLPDVDGLEVIRKAREWADIPIIIVSARGQESEKVEALDAGADDYLTKPFSVAELLARIRVSLRRSSKGNVASTIFQLGDLVIDYERRKVQLLDKDVHLTPTEYRLLTLLAKHHGKVLTHKFLVEKIWGGLTENDTQSLRVCMGNLRRKIESDTAQPKYIMTEIGVGYRLTDEV